MNKGVKIFVGVVAALGIISLIFLLIGKRSTTKQAAPKTSTASYGQSTTGLPQTALPKTAPVKKPAGAISTRTATSATSRNVQTQSQWQQCKNLAMAASTILFWNIQISDSSSFGGYYAKGLLNSDSAYPVHVIINLDAQNQDQIKQRIVAGKIVFLRGKCVGVETDGSVILQAY